MAYLTANEIKRLKTTPLNARLTYIFIIKPRKLGGITAPLSEHQAEEELAQLLTPGGEIDHHAVERRLQTMHTQAAISPTDMRKIRALTGM